MTSAPVTTDEASWLPSSADARMAFAFVVLAPIAFSPALNATFWSTRAALVLVILGLGLPRLVQAVRSGDRPAVFGAIFLAAAGAATMASPQPVLATFGLYGWGTGLLFVLGLVCAWSLGLHVQGRDRDLVGRALLATCALNAVVAIAQTQIDLTKYSLQMISGRSAALLGNPVYLSTLLTGALSMLCWRSKDSPWSTAGIALLACGLGTTGSRIGLAAAGFVAIAAVWQRRDRLLRGAAIAALTIGGTLLGGTLVTEAGGSGLERATESTAQTISARPLIWRSIIPAVVERPVLGSGPGTFRIASSEHRTAEIARAEGPNSLFADAHNILVEYLVTTGVVGLAALLLFLAVAFRRARGPFAAFAAGVLFIHLVQPQNPATTPVALLALGMAMPTPSLRAARIVWAQLGLGAIALAVGAAFLYGDFRMDQARLDFRRRDSDLAIDLLRPWPEPVTQRGDITAFEIRTTRNVALVPVLEQYRRAAIDRDPSDSTLWGRLGEHQLNSGRLEDAAKSFEQALALNPWSARSGYGYAVTLTRLGRDDEAEEWLARVREVAPTAPDLPVASSAS